MCLKIFSFLIFFNWMDLRPNVCIQMVYVYTLYKSCVFAMQATKHCKIYYEHNLKAVTRLNLTVESGGV